MQELEEIEDASRIEKIKEHFKRNKDKYIYTTTGVVVGVSGLILVLWKTGKFNRTTVVIQEGKEQLQVVGDNNKIVQSLTRYGNNQGRPREAVLDVTTGIVYKGKGIAARDVGGTRSQMSEHLKGNRKDVNGHIFWDILALIKELENMNTDPNMQDVY